MPAPSLHRAVPLAVVAVGASLVGVTWWGRPRTVAVEGLSMVPALAPGERLLVLRWRLRAGQLVVVRDPRGGARLLVKRVHAVRPDGALEVRGDNAGASTDSRTFGAVASAAVVGRPVYRYHPPDQAGWLWGW